MRELVRHILFIIIFFSSAQVWADKKIQYYNAMDTDAKASNSQTTLYFRTLVFNSNGNLHKDELNNGGAPESNPGETVTPWKTAQVHDKTIQVAISLNSTDVDFKKDDHDDIDDPYPKGVTVVNLHKDASDVDGDGNKDEKVSEIVQQGDVGVIYCGEHSDSFLHYAYPANDVSFKVGFHWDGIRHSQQFVQAYTNDLAQMIANKFSTGELTSEVTKDTADPDVPSYNIGIYFEETMPECNEHNNYCVDPMYAEGQSNICKMTFNY